MSDRVPSSWPSPIVEDDGTVVEAVHMELLDMAERRLRVWVMWGDTLRSADVVIPEDEWDTAWLKAHQSGTCDPRVCPYHSDEPDASECSDG